MLVVKVNNNGRIRFVLPDGSIGWATLLRTDRTSARIGLEFPKGVQILREELLADDEKYEAIHRPLATA